MADKPPQKKKPSDWSLEAPFDKTCTLEELIAMPPFKEASDQSGYSHTAGSRVPGWIQRRIIYFTEMRGSPYRIQSDVIRDAIYIGLRVLTMRYKSTPDWVVETKMTKAIDKVSVLRRVKKQMEELTTGLEELYRSGDEEKAIEGLEEFVTAVIEMEDTWHKDKIVQSLMDNRTVKDIVSKCSDSTRSFLFNRPRRSQNSDDKET